MQDQERRPPPGYKWYTMKELKTEWGCSKERAYTAARSLLGKKLLVKFTGNEVDPKTGKRTAQIWYGTRK